MSLLSTGTPVKDCPCVPRHSSPFLPISHQRVIAECATAPKIRILTGTGDATGDVRLCFTTFHLKVYVWNEPAAGEAKTKSPPHWKRLEARCPDTPPQGPEELVHCLFQKCARRYVPVVVIRTCSSNEVTGLTRACAHSESTVPVVLEKEKLSPGQTHGFGRGLTRIVHIRSFSRSGADTTHSLPFTIPVVTGSFQRRHTNSYVPGIVRSRSGLVEPGGRSHLCRTS